MNVTTFEDDFFELSEFSDRLHRFIKTESFFVDGSLVITLASKYGSGKTTFLNMWRNELAESYEDDKAKPLVIMLNAWESDYYGAPLFSIINELAGSLEPEEAEKIKSAASKVGAFANTIFFQLLENKIGVDVKGAAEKASSAGDNQIDKIITTDSFNAFIEQKKALEGLKNVISSLIKGSDHEVLFFVDELDRCRPDYAITYLEVIKHIFDIKGAVFILAADPKQLENSARTAFGADLDFEEYYRKFIHREVNLPPITKQGYEKMVSEYMTSYLEKMGQRFSRLELNDNTKREISQLAHGFKLTPRQVQEIFRILGHLLSTHEKNAGNLLVIWGNAAILMCTLRVCQSQTFDSLGKGTLKVQVGLDFLLSHFGKRVANWWMKCFLSGGGLGKMDLEEFNRQLAAHKTDFDPVSNEEIAQFNGRWNTFNNETNHFGDIYKRILYVDQL